MSHSIERYPINPFEFDVNQVDDNANNSSITLANLLAYEEWIEHWLIESEGQAYRASEPAIEARRQQLAWSRGESYEVSRDIRQMAMLLATTIPKVEAEFAGQTVLDIGSGIGRMGEALARNSKSKVTFVDTDKAALAMIGKKAGEKVIADGKELPFEDESFQKTLVVFSSVTWAENPLESAQAINEAMRVTEPEGSIFLIPAVANISKRVQIEKARIELRSRGIKSPDTSSLDPEAMKVWIAQDLVVLNSLFQAIKNTRAEITWSGFVAKGKNTREELEYYSVIIDKTSSIPTDELEANLEFATAFMPAGKR